MSPLVHEPALFRRFPALAGDIPHRPLLPGPTPVAALPLAVAPELFVKCDERCTPLYGGNKPRKLEFVLGDALARRSRRLVTTGGIGTHHGLATTIFARACGLATTLVLIDQPVTAEVRASLRLFAAYGAEVVDARHVRGAAWRTAAVLARSLARGERPRLVPTGGSGATGNLGFVSAAFELAEQVSAGLLPEPAAIFAPIGSGGTVAGLVAGLRLAGLRSEVVGVLATDILAPSPAALARAARATLRRLRRSDPAIRSPGFSAADFPVATGQVGPGYGAATDAAREALELAARAGLRLELTYSAKCFAELLARARAGALPRGPVLFWHTFNAVDPRAGAPGSWRRGALPARLRRLAEEDAA
jgi:D-cysteine desulfhydrase